MTYYILLALKGINLNIGSAKIPLAKLPNLPGLEEQILLLNVVPLIHLRI